MTLEQKIQELAEAFLEEESLFIVDVSVTGTGKGSRVRILLDGDEGVSIDDCAKLSRKLGEALEGDEVIDHAFTLEVSSPGIDFPLSTARQYRKNIGRTLKVIRTGSKEIKGMLSQVNDEGIELTYTSGKGKEKKEVSELIPYGTIEKAIVQISFK